MRVLVCLDGSPGSNAALDSLTQRVWPSGTEITLLTAVPKGETRFLEMALVDSFHEERRELDSAERMLRAHAHFFEQRLSGAKMSVKALAGKPKEILLQYADNWRPDLIIVGSRGKRDSDPLMLGSVSQAMLEHSPCPVLVAKNAADAQEKERTNILVPVDHSPFTAAAIDWLLHQHWTKPARIRLLTVVPRLTCQYSEEEDTQRAARLLAGHQQMEESAMRLLQKCAARIKPKFGTIICEVVAGDPRDAILRDADTSNADLIVMGSHGLSGLSRLLMGSVSRGVSVFAKCSVEVVRKVAPGQMSNVSAYSIPDLGHT